MAKLLDLLVAAEGFVPVTGRVYAQDGDGEVWWYGHYPLHNVSPYDGKHYWGVPSTRTPRGLFTSLSRLADDHAVSVVSAESILEARACL